MKLPKISFFIAFFFLTAFVTFAPLHASATSIIFDSLNRLTSVVYSPTQRIDYVYDAAGNLIEERINGSAGLTVTAQASPSAGGTVSVAPQVSGFVAGDSVTVTATPSVGYAFNGWSGAPGCSTASSCTFTMGGSSVTATANFASTAQGTTRVLRAFAVPAIGGTITPAPAAGGYVPGASVSLIATPAAGYVVDYWYGAACSNFSGPTCTFNMPSADSDVFVVFKQIGSGFPVTVTYGAIPGVTYNPFAGGAVEFSPSARSYPAGTSVTVTMRAAKGYTFNFLVVRSVATGLPLTLCGGITNLFWMPWQTPTCTFAMPNEGIVFETTFMPDPVRYVLDTSVTPASGGAVAFAYTEVFPNSMFQALTNPTGAREVAATVPVTLTAKPLGARQFIRWQNGPCAGSTNPICTFTMPANPVTANPEFGEDSNAACTYSLTVPSLTFPGAGGTRTITVNTQPGCDYNVTATGEDNGLATLNKSGNSVSISVPAHASNFGRKLGLRIHGGMQAFTLPIVQAGNSSTLVNTQPLVTLPTVAAGTIPTATTAITITNNTAAPSSLITGRIETVGSFAVASHTCGASIAAGASCVLNLQFVPNRAGVLDGELMVASTNQAWSIPLRGTATAARTNVAARSNGGRITSTSAASSIYGDAALIEGDRRSTNERELNSSWLTPVTTTQQYLTSTFSSARTIEWMYLFGTSQNGIGMSEPSSTANDSFDQGGAGTLEYWNGTDWQAVTELERVAGTAVWRRIRFQPITTDKVRYKYPVMTAPQFVATELEVWTTLATDTDPVAFTFERRYDVPLNTATVSNTITPTGFNAPAPISVYGPATTTIGGGYSIGCTGVFTDQPGTINPGESVCVRVTSLNSGNSTNEVYLRIGTVGGPFRLTTLTPPPPADLTPDGLADQTKLDAPLSSWVYFDPITIVGVSEAIGIAADLISPNPSEYSVGCTGAYTNQPGTIRSGDTVCVRAMSANAFNTGSASGIKFGAQWIYFYATTMAAPVGTNGQCGSANEQVFATAPVSNLCAAGAPSVVAGTGRWTWTCSGANGGTNASCVAQKRAQTCTNLTGNLLGGWRSYGSVSLTAGVYTVGDTVGYDPTDADVDCNVTNIWGTGSSTGGNAYDFELLTYTPTDPRNVDVSWAGCISATTQSYHGVEIRELEPAFTGAAAAGLSPYKNQTSIGIVTRWDQPGLFAHVERDGTNQFIAIPSATLSGGNYCGSFRLVSSSSAREAYFNGQRVHQAAPLAGVDQMIVAQSFDAPITLNAPVVTTPGTSGGGQCGAASGATFGTAPTSNLCAAGTASAVTGAGPWSWTCNGSSGASSAGCYAHLTTAPATCASTFATLPSGVSAMASGVLISGKIATSTDGTITIGNGIPELNQMIMPLACTGNVDYTCTGCLPGLIQTGGLNLHTQGVGIASTAVSAGGPLISQSELVFATRSDAPGLFIGRGGSGVRPTDWRHIASAPLTQAGYCGDFRVRIEGKQIRAYRNSQLVYRGALSAAPGPRTGVGLTQNVPGSAFDSATVRVPILVPR